MTIALVDCNNFYVSCEKLFNPRLEGRAVVVLSNNDGCVVSRSNEAKLLGIRMAEPWFRLQGLARQHRIVALSSNYTLYADISARVMHTLARLSSGQEIYSIDECFLDMRGLSVNQRASHARNLRETIARDIGIPVCIGMATSKTLAKLANHCAKKGLAGQNGICDLNAMANHERLALYAAYPVEDIWGVGRQLTGQLRALGIRSAEDLRQCHPDWIRQKFSLTLQRTVLELNDIACIDLAHVHTARQQIITSRSFGKPVESIADLREAILLYTTRAAEKLRADGSVAQAIGVHIRSNPFQPEDLQYERSQLVPLAHPTSDTLQLGRAALHGLEQIYRPGIRYKKAGVVLTGLQPMTHDQTDLFDQASPRTSQRMQVVDEINRKMGRDTIMLAGSGISRQWNMQRGRVSPDYTTSWNDLPCAR